MPTIYFITPTYKRLTQKADLTRLSQTLLHVPKLQWILVEDSVQKTDLVTRFLENCGLSYTHLAVRTPKELITKEGDPRWLKARGVEQRNLGLKWIRDNFKSGSRGVVYFGDDDNTYDLRIFEQVSNTVIKLEVTTGKYNAANRHAAGKWAIKDLLRNNELRCTFC